MATAEEEFDKEVELESAEVESPPAEVPVVEEEVPATVPQEKYDGIHQAMDRERHERKEVEAEFRSYKDDMDQKWARADERLRVLQQTYGLVEEEQIDPVEQLSSKVNKQQKILEAQSEEIKQNQMASQLQAQENEFAARTPDYSNARDHYYSTRQNSLMAMGLSAEDASKQLVAEVMRLAQDTLSTDASAPERLYAAAKATGYTPVTAEAEQKLKTIEEGQSASSMPAGGAPKGELTMETLANMTDEEFNKIPEEQLRRVMGG